MGDGVGDGPGDDPAVEDPAVEVAAGPGLPLLAAWPDDGDVRDAATGLTSPWCPWAARLPVLLLGRTEAGWAARPAVGGAW